MSPLELNPGEHIVLSTRKHWFLFFAQMVPFALFALAPFILAALLPIFPAVAPLVAWFDLTSPLGRASLGMWLLLLWTSAWASFTRFYLNLWILTNERIVEIKQPRFFKRRVSSILLPRVQDVTSDVTGLIPSLLQIGGIHVQSAGAVNEFRMHGIPHPDRIRDQILDLVTPDAPHS